MDYFADVSGVHVASIFRIEVCGILSFCEHTACFKSKRGRLGERVGIRAFSEPIGTMDLEVLQTAVLMAQGMHQKIPSATDSPERSPIQVLTRHNVAYLLCC
jgi:hypothetical protein